MRITGIVYKERFSIFVSYGGKEYTHCLVGRPMNGSDSSTFSNNKIKISGGIFNRSRRCRAEGRGREGGLDEGCQGENSPASNS